MPSIRSISYNIYITDCTQCRLCKLSSTILSKILRGKSELGILGIPEITNSRICCKIPSQSEQLFISQSNVDLRSSVATAVVVGHHHRRCDCIAVPSSRGHPGHRRHRRCSAVYWRVCTNLQIHT